jgi:hypothetical protein
MPGDSDLASPGLLGTLPRERLDDARTDVEHTSPRGLGAQQPRHTAHDRQRPSDPHLAGLEVDVLGPLITPRRRGSLTLA